MKKVFIKKSLTQLIKESNEAGSSDGHSLSLKRTLGPFHLTMLGIGAIIGAGIFSLTGTAAAYYAGPGIVYSFILAGLLSALAGLCYAEMAAMIPISGSAYTYSYATLGELIAWIIGWDLVLEYAFGGVAIAISWSGYLFSLITKTLGISLSDSWLRWTRGPWEMVQLSNGAEVSGIWNIPASLIVLLLASVLYRGIRESATLNSLIVLVKVTVILAFVALGWTVIDSALWVANPAATGLSQWVPPLSSIVKNGKDVMSFGWPGVLSGTGVVFVAFIGFDMISTTAQECKNPSRDLPIGILASLVICTILYVAMSLVMTGVVPYQKLGVADPVGMGIDRIVELRGWSVAVQKSITFIVKLGALAGLTSGLLVVLLGQSRIFFAMAKDGLLPWFDRIHPKFSTPHSATIVTAVMVAVLSGIMPLSIVGELISIGTLLAFMIVCIGVPILRIQSPDSPRAFKVPFYGIIAPAGALACVWVMSGLPSDTWTRLLVWLFIGILIYFGYGAKNSKLRSKALAKAPAKASKNSKRK